MDQWNWVEIAEINPCKCSHLIFDKGAKAVHWRSCRNNVDLTPHLKIKKILSIFIPLSVKPYAYPFLFSRLSFGLLVVSFAVTFPYSGWCSPQDFGRCFWSNWSNFLLFLLFCHIEVLIGAWNVSNEFFCICQRDFVFFYLNLLMWLITLIDFLIKSPFVP